MLIAEPFEIGSSCRLVEDDNIIDGAELPRQLQQTSARMKGPSCLPIMCRVPSGTAHWDSMKRVRRELLLGSLPPR